MNRFSLIVSILCYLAVATNANPALFADSDNASVEELASLVCKTTRGTKHQIGRLSSFSAIAEFLSGLTVGHKLFDCRNKYLESLQQLVHVVETASDNVCGEEKLALIEDFHHKFVSKTRKDLKIQKRSSKAPRMAKLFFMQYATEVSSACEQSLVASVARKEQSISADDVAKMEKMKQIVDILGMSDLSKGYKSIYLLWNLIDSLNPSEMYKISKYIAPSGDVRVNFQMKDARLISGVQAICRYRLKPAYQKTMLPALRLIDLGYYPRGKGLLEGLKKNPSVKSQFYAAQICESLLPVGMFSNEQLASDQVVALTTEEASSQVPPVLEGVEKLAEDAPSVDVAPVSVSGQELASIGVAVEEIKLNVANRGKVMGRLLKQVWAHVKTQFKSSVKGFKMFRKNKDQKLEAIDEATLEKVEKASSSLELVDDADKKALTRKRRGYSSSMWDDEPWYFKVGFVIFSVIAIIYLIVLYVFKAAVFGLPSIVVLVINNGRNEKVDQFISWLWKLGNILLPNAGFTKISDA